MIWIESFDWEPVSELSYLRARSGGGTEVARLEFNVAHVGRLANKIDAIVCMGDLQGMLGGELLGVAAADHLISYVDIPARTGIVIAGDMFSVRAANKRGVFGDVAPVWTAFAERFAWVVGVAGNHDDVSNVGGGNIHVLDGDTVVLDGLCVGGIGGSIGRRDETKQLDALLEVIGGDPDLLVMHEGPNGDDGAQLGNADIRELIEAGSVPFTVCGHVHWEDPIMNLNKGQILNVDARVVILKGSR